MRRLGALVLTSAVLASCSGDRGGFGPLPSTTPSPRVASTPGTPAQPSGRVVRVASPGHRFEPATVRVAPRESVILELTNTDARTHSLAVNELSLLMTAEAGETVRLPVTAGRPGSFVMYCSIPGHRQAGHEGRFVVG